ncbi:hypothetical protein GCM10007298_35960 [Williamsia phyllosphaerae]|uniref:DUF3072 domain-containing protein n=2 Tax=Williamsia phyllosphaerae TaxID=885042 RepID=A0ABQ1V3R3_9NOCA|nr:hypothetical protein GCM10007298_35960 [Williamsia phyllosphaerae]
MDAADGAAYGRVMTTSNNSSTPEDSGEVLGADAGNTTEKDPSDWVTGDEPMTGAQRSYLDTLARDAGETISADLNKAEASEEIDRLQGKTDRG